MCWRSKVRKMCLSSRNALYMVTKYPWATTTNYNYNLTSFQKQLGQATGRIMTMCLGHFRMGGIKRSEEKLETISYVDGIKALTNGNIRIQWICCAYFTV